MDNTIIQQGSFTSTGKAVTLNLRNGVDWIRVYNKTAMNGAATTAIGAEYFWQSGMGQGSCIEYRVSNAASATNLIKFNTTGGFTLFDDSVNVAGPMNTDVTAVSNAAIPVVSETVANGLAAGDIVRLTSITGATQLGGMDFTVGHNTLAAGTFSLDYMPQIVAGTVGNWQKINVTSIFYPKRRTITKAVSAGATTVITTSVTHAFTIGQQVRIAIPKAFGMEVEQTQCTITAINTAVGVNTFTVDLDTSAQPAFVFPLTGYAFTPAQVVPVGENTALALSGGLDILADATINVAQIGVILSAGVDSPAGLTGNEIFWMAGTSFKA
jgi:hypothetical protein